jgi:polysaccharide pyruvyl transferase CsaB
MLLGKLHGKPIYMVAQGIGPIRRRLFRRMTRSMFRSASYISVRDRVSQQELESMGLPVDRIVLTTDPVWALPVDFLQATETVGSQAKAETVGSQAKAETVGSSQAENKSKRVLLSLRPWGSDPSLEDKWVDLIGRLQGELQVDVDILSFHRAQDTPLAERIASRAGCGWISHMDQPEAMLDRIGKADLLIGVRLHSLIFSALVETPFIGISYDPKVDAFVHAMEAGPVYSIESFSVTNLVEEAKMRLDDADFRKELQIKSRAMRDQASRDQKMMIQELLNE